MSVRPSSTGNADIARLDTFTWVRAQNLVIVGWVLGSICHFVSRPKTKIKCVLWLVWFCVCEKTDLVFKMWWKDLKGNVVMMKLGRGDWMLSIRKMIGDNILKSEHLGRRQWMLLLNSLIHLRKEEKGKLIIGFHQWLLRMLEMHERRRQSLNCAKDLSKGDLCLLGMMIIIHCWGTSSFFSNYFAIFN